MNHLRAGWRRLAYDDMTNWAYRGVPVEVTPAEARPILDALAQGATRLLADEIIDAMARGTGSNRWEDAPNAPRAGAGPWWTTDYSAAFGYAGSCSIGNVYGHGQRGNLFFPVVMKAEADPMGEPEHIDGQYQHWWKLEDGTPLTVVEFEVGLPSPANARELVRILDKQGAWDDTEGMFDIDTWEQGEVTDERYFKLSIPPMKTQALPSWRPYQNDRTFWEDHDAVIATDKAGRRRTFEVWVDGKPFTRGQTLQEAKDRVEVRLGPLVWHTERMDPSVIEHYWWGETPEFTEPLILYWADR